MGADRRARGGAAGRRALTNVYVRLKDAIITGSLRPMERITENKVAASYGL